MSNLNIDPVKVLFEKEAYQSATDLLKSCSGINNSTSISMELEPSDTISTILNSDLSFTNQIIVPVAIILGDNLNIATDSDSQFDIDLEFAENVTPEIQAIFEQAKARWEELIIGDIRDINVPGIGLVDDLVIEVSTPPIDGEGNILGQAGPTYLRKASSLPATGIMEFDSADVDSLIAEGQFDEVILHEMGHVLGLGTIWQKKHLLKSGNLLNPSFTGPLATAEYNNIFGVNKSGVPVEGITAGPGTAFGHWRESIFDNELMTGYLNQGESNPLSRITVASMADLGYQVDISKADVYSSPGSNVIASANQLDGQILDTINQFTVI